MANSRIVGPMHILWNFEKIQFLKVEHNKRGHFRLVVQMWSNIKMRSYFVRTIFLDDTYRPWLRQFLTRFDGYDSKLGYYNLPF